jgi:hypothetical protein
MATNCVLVASGDPRRRITMTRRQRAEVSVVANLNACRGPGSESARQAGLRMIEGCRGIPVVPKHISPQPLRPGYTKHNMVAQHEYSQDVWQLILRDFPLREMSELCSVCRTWRDAAHAVVRGWGEFDINGCCGGSAAARDIINEPRRLRSLASWLGGSVHILKLSGTDIADEGVRILVDVDSNRFRCSGVAVQYLDMSFCARLSDLCVPMLGTLPLEHLNLDGVHRISNRGLVCLASTLGCTLTWLHIDGESLSDDALREVIGVLPLLTSFGISFCEQLSDNALLVLHGRYVYIFVTAS